MQADGLSLDDKRDPVDECDIPDILEKWANLDPNGENDRTSQGILCRKNEIVGTTTTCLSTDTRKSSMSQLSMTLLW